jgi:hypothetical protein
VPNDHVEVDVDMKVVLEDLQVLEENCEEVGLKFLHDHEESRCIAFQEYYGGELLLHYVRLSCKVGHMDFPKAFLS